jgi:hypothetical protein
MAYSVLKIALSGVLIFLISELAKRSTFAGSLLASIPLISVLSLIWLYVETRNVQTAIRFSYGVFWMVLPSLILFLVFPELIRRQVPFAVSITLSCAITALAYYGMILILGKSGIKI